MATLPILSGPSGPLTLISVPLGPGRMPERLFYAMPDFMPWMTAEVPAMNQGRLNATQTPKEQLDNLLHKWIAGKPMKYPGTVNDLKPLQNGVWELKSIDLRIFGWIYRRKIFIASLGGYADDYKIPTPRKTYGSAIRHVVKDRDSLDLDPPKYTPGDHNALV
jgi:hypothetical protein